MSIEMCEECGIDYADCYGGRGFDDPLLCEDCQANRELAAK